MPKFRWRKSNVIIAGYSFTVHVHDIREGKLRLERDVKDKTEAEKILNILRMRYGDELMVRINNKKGKYRIIIPSRAFKNFDDIKEQVIQVLCRKFRETIDEAKRQGLIKALRRLTPTEGAAVARN